MNKTVNIHDIVPYVREMIDRDEWPVNTQEEIIDALETVIGDLGTPDMTMEESYARGEHVRQHYDNAFWKYHKNAENFKELMRLGFFFAGSNCYQFNQLIEVSKDHKYHPLMFVLMLNQYAEKLVNLDFFLEYQYKKVFNVDREGFLRFLELIGRQHKDLLDSSVFTVVEEWSEKRLKRGKNSAQNSVNARKRTKECKTDFNSFQLKSLETDPDYFLNHVNDLTDMVINLRNSRFIHPETTVNQVKKLFSNEKFDEQNQIVWIGSIKELQWFVKYLVDVSEKVVNPGKDIWWVACKCFVDRAGKQLEPKQLRLAQGKKHERRKQLEDIMSIL